MKNKVLINLIVPEIDKNYSIYIPVNKKIGNVVNLLSKAVNDLSEGEFPVSNSNLLYNANGKKYDVNSLVIKTDIRNSSTLVLISA